MMAWPVKMTSTVFETEISVADVVCNIVFLPCCALLCSALLCYALLLCYAMSYLIIPFRILNNFVLVQSILFLALYLILAQLTLTSRKMARTTDYFSCLCIISQVLLLLQSSFQVMGPGATVNSIIAAMRSDQSTKTRGDVIISHFQDVFKSRFLYESHHRFIITHPLYLLES